MTNQSMADKVANSAGFIAALDQSGGSTPKALRLYGVDESAYSNDEEMFAQIHEMRSRIITAPSFNSDKVLGAILFERTMRGKIGDTPVAQYMWENRGVVPFLKIDKGLEEKVNDAQVMKPMPGLNELLADARGFGVFGTKMRSVIHGANADGIKAVVDQQFEVAKQVCAAGLIPIIEPEIDIHSDTKAEAETLLNAAILESLNTLSDDQTIMLKLTIPSEDNLYADLIAHPRVMRVVALSGGYSTDDACARLARNDNMIASFSRALAEGLTKQQSEDDFHAALSSNIDKIYAASC